jgi:hypothetical protein
MLPLVEKAMLERRQHFLCAARVVDEIAVATTREGDAHRVMEVVVPHPVQAESALVGRQQMLAALRFVLGDEDDVARRRFPTFGHELRQDVRLAVIEDRLRRIEPEAVEPKLAQPVLGVVDDEIARARTVFAVEVECIAPIGAMRAAEVMRAEAF